MWDNRANIGAVVHASVYLVVVFAEACCLLIRYFVKENKAGMQVS